MPELPEVETVRRGLQRSLVGLYLESVEVREARCFQGSLDGVRGAVLTEIDRRGKCLRFVFDSGWSMLGHLRMTGQMIFVSAGGQRTGGGRPDDGLLAPLPSTHTRVILHWSLGGRLFFNDQRKFGYLKTWPSQDLALDTFWHTLGPEPWDEALTPHYLHGICQRRKMSSIKSILLDQKVMAGLGNIYVDEALFLSGIRPETHAGQLSLLQLEQIIAKSRHVLEQGILFGGVSVSDYVNAEGLRGSMQQQLYVYGRDGLPCKRCQTPILKIAVAGRGTHVCPTCQS